MHRCMGCMREYDAQFDVCPYCGYILDTPAKNKNHLSPGTLLQDRYVLGKVLGQGGFGITYIAWDQRLEKPVAVKEFFPTSFAARMTGCNDISCFDDESRHYFESGMKNMLDESRRLAQFTDLKNVVQVLDCIEENGTAYIIMELLRGETVQDILRRDGKMSLEQSMGIMMPILQALEQIHRTGLVHRDVSPDNIFLCEDGQAKLLDFGAARIASGLDHKTLSIMLKKGFAPIEQYNSHGTQGSFTDVYAVCATLYKMLTGVTPEDSLSRMTQDKLRPLSNMVSIPKSIERILQKGMAVQASDRIQTAGELYARLLQALQEEQARAAAQQAPKKRKKKKHKIAGKNISVKNIRIACLSAAAVLLVAAIVAGIVFGVPWLRSRRAAAVYSEPSYTPPNFAQGTLYDELNSSIQPGDTVVFGNYAPYGIEPEPIEWLALDRIGDEVLLLSKKVLDYQQYHDDSGLSFTWETCRVREWLNTEFYDAAFSEAEKEKITLHQNVTPDEPDFGADGGNDTMDRCFLLSLQEVEGYFPNEKDRVVEYTDALISCGNDYSGWALRTASNCTYPAENNMQFSAVSGDGSFYFDDNGLQSRGIRPAVWVDIGKSAHHAAEEWVSGHRTHLYDVDWSLEGSVLHIFGQGVMPEYYWDGEGLYTDMVTEVVIEQGVSTVASCAFYGFLNLKAVSMADSVTAIGSWAFADCPKLQTIQIPSSVTRIGQSIFTYSGIVSNKTYWKDGLFCIDHCLIRASKSLTGFLKIPSDISVIAEFAFDGCNIDSVEVPNSVTCLDRAFTCCEGLRFVQLPDSIEQIVNAFDFVWSIETVAYQGTEEQWNNIHILDDNADIPPIEFNAQSVSPFAGLQVGDTVKFGTFEQDNNTDNGQEEIEWLVIDTSEDGGSLLLLSRQALYCTAYNQERAPTTWKACSVRQWLNGSFYKDHFTAEEREYILKTQLDNPDNESYNSSGGEDTEDYIFLLSLQQAESMQAASRKAKPTAYAISCGAFEHEETGNTWWTLRSPGSANTLCAIVRSDGEIRAGGEAVDASGSIRPAMWVSA